MSAGLGLLTAAAAVGSATVGGVFYAFSTFVMPALRRLPAPQGVAAMQSINNAAVRTGLMAALFGTAAVCTVVTVWAGLSWQPRRSVPLIAGSLLYLAGAIGVTSAHNVPLNNALARLDPTDSDTARAWQHYLTSWTKGTTSEPLPASAAPPCSLPPSAPTGLRANNNH